ncbi:hypothetical protein DN050_14615 [Heyndrickxia coagulans]|nr:hypothetical protein DN050_14615 [Heyndrickxia coagulans]
MKIRFCLLYTLNQLSSASFSLDFLKKPFKFLPKLSASLPNLGILRVQQARRRGKMKAFLHLEGVYVKEA